MSKLRRGRALDALLLLDKPSGITSNRALQAVRRALGAKKAGHTGSLDPLASGMLPICFGAATRLSQFLLDAHKTYRVRCTLGVGTDTGDADGREIARGSLPSLSLDEVRMLVRDFVGESDQVPPMYSALKHGGQRLYALARRGLTVEREARRITVHALDELGVAWPELAFTVVCSKGTYVRALVEDIAGALGTVGHVSGLRRLGVGPFTADQMIGFEEIQELATSDPAALDRCLLPMDRALPAWPSVNLAGPEVDRLCHGQAIGAQRDWPAGHVKLYGPRAHFFGLGEVLPSGTLAPRRIFAGTLLGESTAVRVE